MTGSANMLEVSKVWKSYGRTVALRDVSFSVPRGDKVLLLGPNGAGKSTMVKMIMGLQKFRGAIRVDGFDVAKEGSKALARVGYLPQSPVFYDKLTVAEEAKLLATVKGVSAEAANAKLAMVGLGEKSRRKSMRSLSGGMRQRFALAMALLTDPPFLVFDEPLASIDLRGQLGFLEFVKRLDSRGTTVLIATHLTGFGDIADKVVVLNRGRVMAEGTPRDLMAKINADEVLYVKPKDGAEDQLARLVEGEADVRAIEGGKGGRLMVISVPAGSKLRLLKILLAESNSALVEDVSMDPSKIESSYGRLLQRTSPPSTAQTATKGEDD